MDESSIERFSAKERLAAGHIPLEQLPKIEQVSGQLELQTRVRDDGLVDIVLNGVEPAHIQALFKGDFALSVEQAVTVHFAQVARLKEEQGE